MISSELRELFENRYNPKIGGTWLLPPIDALAFIDIALEFEIEIVDLEYFTIYENMSIQPDMSQSFFVDNFESKACFVEKIRGIILNNITRDDIRFDINTID